jgi:hypothetical protein
VPCPAATRWWAASANATPSPQHGSRIVRGHHHRENKRSGLLVGREAPVLDEVSRKALEHECHDHLPTTRTPTPKDPNNKDSSNLSSCQNNKENNKDTHS